MRLGKQTALIGVLTAVTVQAEFRAGVAKLDITPTEPIWMSGYAGRKQPSQGVTQRLWAKALAVEDGRRGKAVIVTSDLIGLPRNVSDIVAARVLKEYGVDRARLLLNSSHTHAGPVVRPNLMTMYFLDGPQKKAVEDYAAKLTEDLVSVIGAAIGDLARARLSMAHGKASFAANRRVRTAKGVNFGVENSGPVDHDVPVLAVRGADGKLRAALFGYACHNTTLGGENYQISGDYAGAAQLELEALQPGVMAMFLMLAGADQNPNPRGTVAHVEQHGKALAAEVHRVLGGKMKPVAAGLRAAYRSVELEFAPHTREQFEEESKTGNPYQQSRAREMLKAYDERRPVRRLMYPVQAIRLGKDVTFVGMGGEVVVDYGLQTKREFAGHEVIVAGYTHDVMSYIPTVRILREGGYEPNTSMIYYGMPGPYAENVEERIFHAIRQVLGRVGLKRSK
jgi:hypothetical protein